MYCLMTKETNLGMESNRQQFVESMDSELRWFSKRDLDMFWRVF